MNSTITFQTGKDEDLFVRVRVVTKTHGAMPMEFNKAADVFGPVEQTFHNELVPVARIMTEHVHEGPSTLVFLGREYQTEAVLPSTCTVTATLCVGRRLPDEELETLLDDLIMKPIIAKQLDPVFEQDVEDSRWAVLIARMGGGATPLSDLELQKLEAQGSPDTQTYENALPIEVPVGSFTRFERSDPEGFAPHYIR